jgi:hypothetical protein
MEAPFVGENVDGFVKSLRIDNRADSIPDAKYSSNYWARDIKTYEKEE